MNANYRNPHLNRKGGIRLHHKPRVVRTFRVGDELSDLSISSEFGFSHGTVVEVIHVEMPFIVVRIVASPSASKLSVGSQSVMDVRHVTFCRPTKAYKDLLKYGWLQG